jgi:hypothetical protein
MFNARTFSRVHSNLILFPPIFANYIVIRDNKEEKQNIKDELKNKVNISVDWKRNRFAKVYGCLKQGLLGVGRHWWHNRDPELSCFNGRIRAS